MKKFLQLVVLIMLAMYNAIQQVTGGTTLKKLMPTGVIEQGILGGFSGKVGPVVGGNWKGINYMRGYVVPANPNTTAQQTQRTKFGLMVAYAKNVIGTLLQPFWDPFAVQMSGFNYFIQQNINLLTAGNLMTTTAKISVGSLEQLAGSFAGGESLGAINISWAETVSGNGELTDSVGFALFSQSEQNLYCETPSVIRDDESYSWTPPVTPAAGDILYGFTYRGTGESFTVSNSVSATVS